MSQFRSRYQTPYSRPQDRENDIRLRTPSESHSAVNSESPYTHQHTENQKIKNLSFWNNNDGGDAEESDWTERQSPMPFILGIIILVVACTVLWFLFRWASGDNTNTPPVIAADTAPFKVRPENPGGMMIPHQNMSIYGRISQNTPQPVERLLPLPEQPMIAPPPQMNGQQVAPSPMNVSPMGNPPQAETHSAAQNSSPMSPSNMSMNPPLQNQPSYPPAQAYNSPQQAYGPTPSMMQSGMQAQPTMPPTQSHVYPPNAGPGSYPQPSNQGQAPHASLMQPPNGPNIALPSQPQSSSPQVPLQAAANPVPPAQLSKVEEIKPASDEDEADDTMTEAQNELDKLIAKESERPLKKQPAKAEKNSPKPTHINPDRYKVQIASLPSRSMADKEMKRLRVNHHGIFQNKPWDIQRINLGGDRGVTHRLVVGSFSNHAAASQFCKKLRTKDIRCMVIAPSGE